MKKYLTVIALIMCVVFVGCGGDKKQEAQQQVQEKPKPTIIGKWYGYMFSDIALNPIFAIPFACGAPDHSYAYNYFEFSSDGFFIFTTLEIKYKYKDNGDYLSLTDEFDRPKNTVLQINQLTDSSCVIRINERSGDRYVWCSRDPNKRREYYDTYFGEDAKKYKDADEWKVERKLYTN